MKKDQIYQIRAITVIIVLENQTVPTIQETNHLKTLTTEEGHQTKENQVISHKKDI